MDVHPVDFFVLGLATWRLSSLLVKEDGPWNILARMRQFVGVRFDEASQAFGLNVVAGALACMWCASVWVGVAFALAFLVAPTLTVALALPFTLSAAALLVDKAVNNE